VLLPSAGLVQQHAGGSGAAALAAGSCPPRLQSNTGFSSQPAKPSCRAPRAAGVMLPQARCCREPPSTTTTAAGSTQGQGPRRGGSQLGLREAESLHGTAQALAHPADGQQAVPHHNAGAGAARGGHGRQALPLVLLGVEGLCRLQDSGLVSWKHKERHWVTWEAPASIPSLLWDSICALDPFQAQFSLLSRARARISPHCNDNTWLARAFKVLPPSPVPHRVPQPRQLCLSGSQPRSLLASSSGRTSAPSSSSHLGGTGQTGHGSSICSWEATRLSDLLLACGRAVLLLRLGVMKPHDPGVSFLTTMSGERC